MKDLIIFDCDGVLVDSEHLANQALVDCLAEIQIKMTVDTAIQHFKGRKMADCFSEIEKTNNCILLEKFEASFRERMSEYFESRLKPIHGIADSLERIPHSKCVASNGPLKKTKRNLEIVGLAHHFGENIFSAYSIQKWKPEPDLFLHACREMASLPSNTIVVEDSELGIQAALAGGFKVLAFRIETVQNIDVVPFQDMSELPHLIDRLLLK